MLGLAEYSVISSELWSVALYTQQSLNEALTPDLTRQQAVKVTERFAKQYMKDYRNLLNSGLEEIAHNSLNYYQMQLGFQLDDYDQVVQGLLGSTYEDPYYGISLKKRLQLNETRMFRNITKSSLWGAEFEGLHRLFTHPIPYGSQFNFDKRILLSQAVKLEQDAAKAVADAAEIELVKWSLSGLHPKPDICDDYATYVNQDVVRYIEKNKLDINPRGVYFLKDLPPPPHPNCMCEAGLIAGKRVTGGPVKRTIKKIRNLLSRFRRK